MTTVERQALVDRFYLAHGPCCAGCDHWRHFNVAVGECIKSAPVDGDSRAAMLGISKVSMELPAGHILTPRDHVCGDFIDTDPLLNPAGANRNA